MLKSRQAQGRQELRQGQDEDIDLSNPFALLKLFAPPKSDVSQQGAEGRRDLRRRRHRRRQGRQSLFGGESVGSTTMIEAIRKAENDKTVKAIVLRVDSPGGSALASDLIWNELKRCKKPVIASMSRRGGQRRLLHQHGRQEDLCRAGHADRLDRRRRRQDGARRACTTRSASRPRSSPAEPTPASSPARRRSATSERKAMMPI